MATPKKAATPPAGELLKLPPSNLKVKVRINNPDHPHHGKQGWDTGEEATSPGGTALLHKVVWHKGGEEGCYADPADLEYPNIPKVKTGKRDAEDAPSPRVSAWAIKQKPKIRPTNRNPMQNQSASPASLR